MKGILKGFGVCILLAILVGAFSLSAMAQAPKSRNFKINALINMNNETYKPDDGKLKLNGYNILGGVGFFINDMFEVGPEISVGQSKTDFGDGDELTFSQWALGVKANAHFNTDTQVIPYVGLNLAFASRKLEIFGDSTDDTAPLYGLQAGLDYFITEKVSVNPELRYTMGKFSFDGDDTDYSNLSFMVGFAVHL